VQNLKRASEELFTRKEDERCESLQNMAERCRVKKAASQDRWESPKNIHTIAEEIISTRGPELRFIAGSDGYYINDWSFSQLCRMSGIAKDTVNRLSPDTATRVFKETLPRKGEKPLQIFTEDDVVRSIHGTAYTRLWDLDVVNVLREFAVDFQPPQKGFNGATGLYVGEQDMFAFMIDPNGWCEIGDDAFAPGFFTWNSEVGRRSLGIQTFWFQAVCANHIVWDATEVVEWTRKHTANIKNGLSEVRSIIAGLVQKRDERKDGFHRLIKKAMEEKLGDDAEEAMKMLTKNGIGRSLAQQALKIAEENGRFTIWSLVDALTRLSRDQVNAGDRLEMDGKAAGLLQLVEV